MLQLFFLYPRNIPQILETSDSVRFHVKVFYLNLSRASNRLTSSRFLCTDSRTSASNAFSKYENCSNTKNSEKFVVEMQNKMACKTIF